MSTGWFAFWLCIGAVVLWLGFQILMGMAVLEALPPVFRAKDEADHD